MNRNDKGAATLALLAAAPLVVMLVWFVAALLGSVAGVLGSAGQ